MNNKIEIPGDYQYKAMNSGPRLPKDPWDNEYQFLNPGIHSEIDVFSYGADRKPGGEG